MPAHPHWCVGKAGGCVGTGHQSAELAVPADETSGIEVKASLWSGKGGREFVALAVTPVRDNFVALALACDLAEGITEFRHSSDMLGADAAAPPLALIQDASDPEYITDPHAHDFTIDQAEALHRALGQLLDVRTSQA
ncbi:MAG TPA: hypothetical protein VLI54_03030 [Bacillota bacterium]|nr:hypothetical protein [Bacillota bacterium]